MNTDLKQKTLDIIIEQYNCIIDKICKKINIDISKRFSYNYDTIKVRKSKLDNIYSHKTIPIRISFDNMLVCTIPIHIYNDDTLLDKVAYDYATSCTINNIVYYKLLKLQCKLVKRCR